MQKAFFQQLSYQFSQLRKTRINIFQGKGPNSVSGIRATIYGGTGFLGPFIGSVIGQIGSDVIFPHDHIYGYNDEVKELKLCATTGKSVLIRKMDYDDANMIEWTMQNSNVVVNLLGPRRKLKHLKDFEYINIEVPKRLAQACAANPGVIRMIHFSSAGTDPNSESMDLRTKYYGEQEVLNAFPNATIIKPCTVVGQNDNLVRRIVTQREYLYNFNVVFDDCQAKRQPILVNDLALAVFNALKLPETVGKMYELGGPNVYTMLEIYETIFNYIERPPKLVHFPKQTALQIAQKIPNWNHFNREMIAKDGCDVVCSKGSNQIDQLFIRPVSFPQMLPKLLADERRRPSGQMALEER